MSPFVRRFPGLGEKETRVATLVDDGDPPAGEYAFFEFYCDEPGCDCRRVVIQVVEQSSPKKIWATMNYGWEKPEYYVKWMGSARLAEEAAGLTLDPLFPQTEYAPALLSLFEHILQDPAYVERLKRHYVMFKGIGAPRSSEWESHDRSGRAKRPRLGPKKWKRPR
jgi:hypothetical protein